MTPNEILNRETGSSGEDRAFHRNASTSVSGVQPSLPVVTFEQFMLASESDAWPMAFVISLEYQGQLDQCSLQHALVATAPRHPLLFSRLSHDHKSWIAADVPLPQIVNGPCSDFPKFDLEQECGIQVYLSVPSGNLQTISFAFHHACTDGMGAFQFLKDFSRHYVGDLPDIAESAMESLRYLKQFRDSAGRNRLIHFLRWPVDLLGQIWALEMILNRPKAIEPKTTSTDDSACVMGSATPPQSTGSTHEFQKLILSRDETHQAKVIAKKYRQTLNDRVMEAAFQAIESWNIINNPVMSGELVRLMIPMNLRGTGVPTAANMVAMVNFDRRVGRWKSRSWFRRVLRWEMLIVKKIRAGVTANRYLQLQKIFGGQWTWLKNQQRCLASCVVSNLGDTRQLFRNRNSGGIDFCGRKLEGLQIRGPLRPRCNLMVCLFSHENQLQFDLTYNAAELSEAEVVLFQKMFVGHLLSL